jgi:hypothetical protein
MTAVTRLQRLEREKSGSGACCKPIEKKVPTVGLAVSRALYMSLNHQNGVNQTGCGWPLGLRANGQTFNAQSPTEKGQTTEFLER